MAIAALHCDFNDSGDTGGRRCLEVHFHTLERNERNKIKILLRSKVVCAILYLYSGLQAGLGLPVTDSAFIITVFRIPAHFLESDLFQHVSAACIPDQCFCVNAF